MPRPARAADSPGEHAQFAVEIAGLLRQSRIRQRLTQVEISRRTGGVISKAALANYESAARSLRIENFWLICRALEEEPGAIIAAATRRIGLAAGQSGEVEPVTVTIAAIETSEDPRLSPVRRWFALRAAAGNGPGGTVTLDSGALVALAALMDTTPAECRALLAGITAATPTTERRAG